MPTLFKSTGSSSRNVLEAARERFRLLYGRFDTVAVAFSGGKDSTVCLHLALEAAKEAGKLPIHAYFWDEEVIHPETIEYVERVRQRPDVKLRWLCWPVKHRNACSRSTPYWYCWDPEQEAKWVRPKPACAEPVPAWFRKGMTIPDAAPYVYGREWGTVADVRGIRADESLRRLMSVTNRIEENWMGQGRDGHSYPASPIYDWTTPDVWTAPRLHGWDYNHAYDLFHKAGIPFAEMRVTPPFGEEPLEQLGNYVVCWPDLWHKMIGRVPGAATAGRYCKTELYGYGGDRLPTNVPTWREWCEKLLRLYPNPYRAQIAHSVAAIMKMHKEKTSRPIPDALADPYSGLSWKTLANIVNRGDMKGRRRGSLHNKAILARERNGTTLEQVQEMERDGATRY